MPFDLSNPKDRARAEYQLFWVDHGFLRAMFRNWRVIEPGVMYRSNQPSPAHVKRAKKEAGIKTIINLRGRNDSGHDVLEREAAKAEGIVVVDFTTKSRDTPQKELIFHANELFQAIQYPALMHCKSGADRAGLMGVLYRVLKMGDPVGVALEQLSFKYLHVRAGKTGMLDHFFETYLKWVKENGKVDTPKTFLAWVHDVYDPDVVKADFMSSWWGNLLTEKVLRRE